MPTSRAMSGPSIVDWHLHGTNYQVIIFFLYLYFFYWPDIDILTRSNFLRWETNIPVVSLGQRMDLSDWCQHSAWCLTCHLKIWPTDRGVVGFFKDFEHVGFLMPTSRVMSDHLEIWPTARGAIRPLVIDGMTLILIAVIETFTFMVVVVKYTNNTQCLHSTRKLVLIFKYLL